MEPIPFQIKIGLVGHVSAGKTTVLNALFGAPFGEISMKRTTAGFNYFQITSPDDMDIAPGDILEQTKTINLRLRRDPKIEEQYFDVSMREPLLTTMRRNTQLVVVDIPGLNEAGTSNMYKTHVAKIWDTFDCVICVMDVYQGVNTEEQVQLLKFVKENADKNRSPVIILCNKVDEPENSEIQGLMTEMKEEVEKIGLTEGDFIPISAQNAYLYRAASGLSMQQYASLSAEHIQSICKKELGQSGLEMTEYEQQQLVLSIVNDPQKYQARLQKSNFCSLTAALNRSLGTMPLQAQALRRQIDVMHAHFQRGCAYDGVPIDQLQDRILRIWWDLWSEMKDDAMQNFRSDPDAREELRDLFHELPNVLVYAKAQSESSKKIYDAVKLLVQEKCGVIVGHILETPPDGNSKWRFCLRDWSDIIESVALLSHNQVFVKNFERQIADLRFAMCTLSSRGDLSELRRVLIPETPKDPDHWGHLEWLVCQYLEENGEEALILINNSRCEKHCASRCEEYLVRARGEWELHCENRCERFHEYAQGQWEKHCKSQCDRYHAYARGQWEDHCASQWEKLLEKHIAYKCEAYCSRVFKKEFESETYRNRLLACEASIKLWFEYVACGCLLLFAMFLAAVYIR